MKTAKVNILNIFDQVHLNITPTPDWLPSPSSVCPDEVGPSNIRKASIQIKDFKKISYQNYAATG